MARNPSLSSSKKKVYQVKLFPDVFNQELEFLLCGRTGVGKSSLINSLIGSKVCEVGDPTGKTGFNKCTPAVSKTIVHISGVIVSIFDSPGLQDGTNSDEEYLEDMYSKCKDVDLVIYCIDMTVPRYTEDEIRATQLMTNKFGTDFWNRCVLVLTKANNVRVPPREKKSKREYHIRLYNSHKTQFSEQLIDQGVPKDVAKGIPAVAAGCFDPEIPDDDPDNERFIWYVSDKAKLKSSDERMDFLKELWLTCFERTTTISTQCNFMRATARQQFKPLEGDSSEKRRLFQLLRERDEYYQQQIRFRNQPPGKFVAKQAVNMQQTVNVSAPPPYTPRAASITLVNDDLKRMSDAMERENKRARALAAGAASGTVAGAAIGAVVAGPVGAAVGGAIGGVTGTVVVYITSLFFN